MKNVLLPVYEDELLYSYFARVFIHFGYMEHRTFAENVFDENCYKVNTVFYNRMKPEFVKNICSDISMEDLIKQHTVYLYHSRFIEKDKNELAYKALYGMQGDYYNLLPNFNKKEKKYLRYCPCCVKEDRERCGEAYWHMNHQLEGIKGCIKHKCMLIDSVIPLASTKSQMYYALELIVNDGISEEIPINENQIMFYKYLWEIVLQEDAVLDLRAFMKAIVRKSKYTSKSGSMLRIKELFEDYIEFINGKGLESSITNQSQMGKLVEGTRCNPYEICMLGYFLGMSPNEYLNVDMKDTIVLDFENKIIKCVEEGLSLNQIARNLSISSKLVRDVCGKYGKTDRFIDEELKKDRKTLTINKAKKLWLELREQYPDKSYSELCVDNKVRYLFQLLKKEDKEWTEKHPFKQKIRDKNIDYAAYDREIYPMVKNMVDIFNGVTGERPRKVSVRTIERKLSIPQYRLDKCPKSKKYIEKYVISQKEYYAKELVWAVRSIQSTHINMNLTQIMKLTNMKKRDVIDSIPYIDDLEVKELINSLIF